MAIPEFTPEGQLPPGTHRATWQEFIERFTFTERRAEIADTTLVALTAIALAGGTVAWINGSFATAENEPNDIDVLYSVRGVHPRLLDPTWTDPSRRKEHRETFAGDYIAVDDDDNDPRHPRGLFKFFGTDRDERPKGLVEIDLSSLPPL